VIFRFAAHPFALCTALLACAGVGFGTASLAAQAPVNPPATQAPVSPPAAEAQVSMSAHYAIIMAHIHVGKLTWVVNFSDDAYLASANGKASGIFSVLVNGEGSVTTHGRMADGRLIPTSVTATVTDDDGRDETQMMFDNGVLKQVNHHGPPPKGERIEVTPDLLHNVIDPLTALLVPVKGDPFAQANCDKTLRIFDGRRRYNLALSFKRVDTMKIAAVYSGKALVCGVVLRAIAGYRTDSLLVRYLAGKGDLELWFAPVKGLALLAPVRAVMPTLIGTLELRAIEFVVESAKTAPEASPPPAKAEHPGSGSGGATNCIGDATACPR
jgi:Protein of unknown function (DUF3108)